MGLSFMDAVALFYIGDGLRDNMKMRILVRSVTQIVVFCVCGLQLLHIEEENWNLNKAFDFQKGANRNSENHKKHYEKDERNTDQKTAYTKYSDISIYCINTSIDIDAF